MSDITQINPHLFISSWDPSNNEDILIKYKIAYIFCLNTHSKSKNVMDMYRRLGISHIYINIADSVNSNIYSYLNIYAPLVSNIYGSNKPVLIHCTAGISRSSTLLMASIMYRYYYLIRYKTNKRGKILPTIYSECKKKRSVIKPNLSFLKSLKNYENYLRHLNSDIFNYEQS